MITASDSALAQFAVADVVSLHPDARAVEGGNAGWNDQGFRLVDAPSHFASQPVDRYRRPYESTDNPASAMQAYLDWEFGLVEQLARDATHRFQGALAFPGPVEPRISRGMEVPLAAG